MIAKCGLCHMPGGIGMLDLVTTDTDLFTRLKNVASKNPMCAPRPYFDANLSDGKATGTLIDRLTGMSCGLQMPLGVPLAPEDVDCIRSWATAKLKEAGN
jgi:hypothetical protein